MVRCPEKRRLGERWKENWKMRNREWGWKEAWGGSIGMDVKRIIVREKAHRKNMSGGQGIGGSLRARSGGYRRDEVSKGIVTEWRYVPCGV